MTDAIRMLLADDIDMIRESIAAMDEYHFSEEVSSRMEALGLSASMLGKRCLVSHTIVDKWRQGKAKPNGKERMKEIGMALEMDLEALDAFLYNNGYPRLYVKNPLDSVARLLLLNSAGRSDIVDMYRELIEKLGLSGYAQSAKAVPLTTTAFSRDFYEAAGQGRISEWFRTHREHFVGDAKMQLPDIRLIRFILLYMGESSIHEMTVMGELPVTLKNLLYPLLSGKPVAVRRLREKLIAFGFYMNMTEEEIDLMLSYAKQRLITEPTSRLDMALLVALRYAHERYPLYESVNLAIIAGRLAASDEEFEQAMLPEYQARLTGAEQRAAYYFKKSRTEDERRFEEEYTSYSDRGVMDYIRDVLELLIADKTLEHEEIAPVWKLIQRT